MNLIVAALAPLVAAASFGGAIVILWRRRPVCRHALSWSGTLGMIAIGWLVAGLEELIGDAPGFGPAAPRLCWLGAALLLVHGLRQRGRRRPRGDVLAAIWAAIALATTLMLGSATTDMRPAMSLMLTAIGAGVAAVAVGPRAILSVAPRRLLLDWIAMALLAAIALACAMAAALALADIGPRPQRATIEIIATLGTVLFGLALLLVLNGDLATALERLARTDPLTGIWNRRGFDEAARHLLAAPAPRFGPRAAVAIADIDAFKGINDRFGHATGDAVLVRFATMLKLALAPGDLLARLGGEEFALLALDCDGATLLGRIERVRAAMARPGVASGPAHGAPLPITASYGIAELGLSTGALRDALERADTALYRAKSEGRDRAILSAVPALDP